MYDGAVGSKGRIWPSKVSRIIWSLVFKTGGTSDERGLEEWLTPVGLTSTFSRLLRPSTTSALIQVGKYCCGLVFFKTVIPFIIRSFAVKRTCMS